MRRFLIFLAFIWIYFIWTSCFAQAPAEKKADELYNIIVSTENNPKYKGKYKREDWISLFDSVRKTSKKEEIREAWEIVYNRLISERKYEFVSVIDWDTINVKNESWESISVRMIWIDAPESSTTRYWYIECFWKESTEHLKQLLSWAKELTLEMDSSQGEVDKYWRTLAYVMYNWVNLSQKMIEDGYWWEYTYDMPYKYQSAFKNAEKEAEKNNSWLWNEKACSWERVESWKEKAKEDPAETLANLLKEEWYNVDSSYTTSSYTSSSSSSKSSSSYTSSSSRSSWPCWGHYWIRWPRWGCYYWSWKSKVYWSHSCCS